MMPDAMKNESQVNIKDSCNNCCCFQWKRKLKNEETQRKVERQTERIEIQKENSPRKVEHTVSHMTLEVTSDEIQFVQEFSVGPEK